jgi:hypothetical protein
MLKYLATAALILISLPALADATGAGFCTVMHEGITACSEEIAATKVRRCPNAIADVKASYDATKDEPNKAMRAELASANAMWLALAQQPTKERLKGASAANEKSCGRLKKLAE